MQPGILLPLPAHFLRTLDQRHQIAGHAGVTGDPQFANDLQLGLGIAGPRRYDGAADLPQRFVKHETQRRTMVGGGILHDVAGPEAGCIERLRPAPVVGTWPFRIEERSRRKEKALDRARVDAQETAKGRVRAL